jgi:MFS superfamily sulfate permease-like transporter
LLLPSLTPCLLGSPLPAEYVLLWLTFMSILQLGLEVGIFVGIILAALYFTWAYAQVSPGTLYQWHAQPTPALPPSAQHTFAGTTTKSTLSCALPPASCLPTPRPATEQNHHHIFPPPDLPQSQITSFRVITAHSDVVRTVEQQAALDMFAPRVATARMQGFVFFGSANSIGLRLHEASGTFPLNLHARRRLAGGRASPSGLPAGLPGVHWAGCRGCS